ncbi:MAG: hypothetical protein PHS41_12305, partial [Victivallaceae bacterium]|nr:hypothetical protein [Victivallaceae bacterium]
MIYFLKSQTQLASVNLVYSGSVVREKKPFRGVSHLAEHLMSYAVRPLEAGYEKSAISSNACTGALHVRFFLQGLESQIRKHAPGFLRRIVDFEPSRELFERERQVVLE